MFARLRNEVFACESNYACAQASTYGRQDFKEAGSQVSYLLYFFFPVVFALGTFLAEERRVHRAIKSLRPPDPPDVQASSPYRGGPAPAQSRLPKPSLFARLSRRLRKYE